MGICVVRTDIGFVDDSEELMERRHWLRCAGKAESGRVGDRL